MKKIRIGTFETNSSSTHVLIMCSEEEYDKYTNDEIRYSSYNPKGFIDKSDSKFENCDTYDEFMPGEDDYTYESFYESHKTSSGETVIAFGYHGNDN